MALTLTVSNVNSIIYGQFHYLWAIPFSMGKSTFSTVFTLQNYKFHMRGSSHSSDISFAKIVPASYTTNSAELGSEKSSYGRQM